MTSDSENDNANSLTSALAQFQAEHHSAGKDKRNAHHGYDYTSLAATNQAIQPAAAVGICHSFSLHPVGTDAVICRLTVTHAPSQESIISEFPILMMKDPKATGSLITYAKKYLLLGAYGLANDSDNDVDCDKKESEQRGQSAPAKASPATRGVKPKEGQKPVAKAKPAEDSAPPTTLDANKQALFARATLLQPNAQFELMADFKTEFQIPGTKKATAADITTQKQIDFLNAWIDARPEATKPAEQESIK